MGEHMFSESDNDRPDVPNMVIILTDGPSANPALTKVTTRKGVKNNISLTVER